ncbi:hypothetical protein JTE90_013458 [Oedothorax gibbosus]|uniref:Uncharacterized protein n=1 Tax=Oedothorax gibbosus TaxID=931172 RepID=A0AAV6VMF0_9ARAC|nr:hypothetical protein JTE90_013458 [Oedothorax gibbosus]
MDKDRLLILYLFCFLIALGLFRILIIKIISIIKKILKWCKCICCFNERHQDDVEIELPTISREAEVRAELRAYMNRKKAENSSENPYAMIYCVKDEKDTDPQIGSEGSSLNSKYSMSTRL